MASAFSKWWRPKTTCFLLLWAGLLWVAPTTMLGDPGTLWHTVVGERMLQTGRWMRTDPFSFTCTGQPWIAQQWLGEIAMALLHRLAGLDGLVLGAVVLLAATYTSLAGRFFRTGLPWPACAVLTMLVIAASSYHFLPRPHLVTIALMAWLFGLLCDVEAGRRKPRRLLILPPVFVLWTNVHGGVLGGIGTATCVLMAWLVRNDLPGLRDRRPSPVAHPLVIGLAVSLSFVAVLVNPYGPALPRVWLSLMGSDVLPKLIVEHAPMQISSTEGAMVLLLAGVYGTLLAVTWRHQRRVTWLVPLLWLGLTFTRIRHGPLFAVTAGIAIADMLPHCLWAERFVRRIGWSDSRAKTGTSSTRRLRGGHLGLRPVLVPAVAVAAAATLQANAIACPLIGAGRCRLSPATWPVEATKVLRAHLQQHPHANARVFNDLGLGGYLIFAAPQCRIYIDDRCELYRDAGLLQYKSFLNDPRLVDAFAIYENVTLALTKTRSRFDRHFATSAAWKPLHRDGHASLYARVLQTASSRP